MPGVGINNIWTLLQAEPKTADRVLRIAHRQDCDNLNPMASFIITDWQILYLIYDTLVRIGPDGKPVPSAASSWEFKSPTVLQVQLKEGLKFHDGKALTAEDVKFTFEYALKWGMPKVAGFVKPVKAVRVIGKNVLEIETSRPTGSLVTGTLAAVPILPKHVWEGLLGREKIAKPADWENVRPVGSGPFKFKYWRRGEEISLEAFKEYHTPAKIDGILQTVYPSPDAVLGAMELGKADLTNQELAPIHADKAAQIKHLTVTETPGIGWAYIGLNMRREPFSDPVFRQALAHATNCAELVEVLLDGHGVPGGAGRVISPANAFWHNPSVKQHEFSIDLARKLLADAGYEWDKEGRLYYPAARK
jgi:peptide/nickel transport system substrate-binding protein